MAMLSYFKPPQRVKSKDVAKERLKFVLFHDHNDLSPTLLNRMKDDIIQVLSQYVEIDPKSVDVEITRGCDYGETTSSAFIANIPIRSVKDVQRG